MRAGLLNQPIEIYKPSVTVNEVGEQVTTYILYRETKARIVYNRQSVGNYNGDVTAPVQKQIEVRIYNDVTEYDRILLGGRYYVVTEVETDEQTRCKRVTITEVNE